MAAIVLFICCVLLHAWPMTSFNLEPRIPVVKQGQSGSYFGYSVALHQVLDEAGTVTENWLLVGAPLGKNLQPGTNHSGAVWKCPLTTNPRDCQQIVTDGRRNLDGYYDENLRSTELLPPRSDEIKEGQWLGVTVRSQGPGKKALVCAHRYIRKGPDYQWGQGLCYTLTPELEFSEVWEPCRGRPVERAHEQFGYCQAGTSGILLDDDTSLMGTPGPYTWRGTVFAVSVSEDFLRRDKSFYYGPLSKDDSPVDKYSYLGMSVTGGRFFGSRMSYVSGAPRSNGTGQVVFFTKVLTATGKTDTQLGVQLVLNGEQFASSYGYELCAADFNGDGRPDLAVGAPFYYAKDSGGAVYLYINPPQGLTAEIPYVRLTGKPESRFGFALANLGDINKDRYEDLAVGAPYDGRGAVYIYLGSKQGIITEPAQVLKAEDLPGLPPVTFGYSLSGGIDMDANGYPDLLVGAYDDDRAFLVRSRPIIGILTKVQPEENLKNIDPNSVGCDKYPNSTDVCFTFDACFKMDSAEVLKSNLELKYRIEAETFSGRKFSRVRFVDGVADKQHVVERNIQLRGRNLNEQCFEETVFVKENTRDIQSAIKFKMSYTLIQREPRAIREGDPLPNINQYPILNMQEASKIFEATFEKDCGDNDVCESELVIAAQFNLPKDDSGMAVLELGERQELVLDIVVTNQRESAYEAGLYIWHPSSLSFIGRTTEANQLTCSSFNSTLVSCWLGNPFKRGSGQVKLRFNPAGLKDFETHFQLNITANTTSQEINPQGLFTLQGNVLRRAEVSINGLGRPEQVFYGGEIKGESAMQYRDEVGQPVLHSYEVYNAGPWRVSSLSVVVSWPYQVENGRPQGKWLLYMDEKPTVDGEGECLMDVGQVNPLDLPKRPGLVETPLEHLTLLNSFRLGEEENDLENEITKPNATKMRRKRDTELIVLPEAITDNEGKTKQLVTMDCDRGTAKCFVFRCNIRNLQRKQSAVIKIRARLWNATLVEDYPRIHTVVIRSKAHIQIDPALDITQRIDNDFDYATTMAYPDRLDTGEAREAPLWIIIVSVLAGIILLVILILVLWKLGFFKRKRPDPMYRGNLEKERLNGEYVS